MKIIAKEIDATPINALIEKSANDFLPQLYSIISKILESMELPDEIKAQVEKIMLAQSLEMLGKALIKNSLIYVNTPTKKTQLQ